MSGHEITRHDPSKFFNRSTTRWPEGSIYNRFVPENSPQDRLRRVLQELARYEHPLLQFGARQKGEAVEVSISFKNPGLPVHTYYFDLHPRDLDDAQFQWAFQRQLYDCLHDYFIEMFIRTPQDVGNS